MPKINAGDHKDRFRELQPDDQTQAEFLAECLDAYEIVDDSQVDLEEIMEMIDLRLGTQVELAAFRGVREAMEEYNDDD
jgi:hypothetical protein